MLFWTSELQNLKWWEVLEQMCMQSLVSVASQNYSHFLYLRKQPHFSHLKSDSPAVKRRTKSSLNIPFPMHVQGLHGSQLRGNGTVAKSYLERVSSEAIVSFIFSGHNNPSLEQLNCHYKGWMARLSSSFRTGIGWVTFHGWNWTREMVRNIEMVLAHLVLCNYWQNVNNHMGTRKMHARLVVWECLGKLD